VVGLALRGTLQLTPRRVRLQPCAVAPRGGAGSPPAWRGFGAADSERLEFGPLEIRGQPRRVKSLETDPQSSKADHRIDVIDLFAHDPKRDEIVLVMEEARPWDGSDERLYQLQEKFNAYVSFLLDGEMAGAHPELVGKAARIELRCSHMPDARVLDLLALIHDQLACQEIKMEVIVRNDEAGIANDESMPKRE
jgi:hypothetical protein